MTLLALPVGPLYLAWKNLMVVNPVAGVVVAATAVAGYAVYEECIKKK